MDRVVVVGVLQVDGLCAEDQTLTKPPICRDHHAIPDDTVIKPALGLKSP